MLPDRVLFKIFSYCLDYRSLIDVDHCITAGLPILFRNVAFVSPDVLDCLYRYIKKNVCLLFFMQNVIMRGHSVGLHGHARRSCNLITLGFMRIGRSAAAICKYILHSCDISELQVFDMSFHGDFYVGRDVLESVVAVRAGFSYDIFQHQDSSNDVTSSDAQLQRFFAEHVPERAPALKRMGFEFWKGPLYSLQINLVH